MRSAWRADLRRRPEPELLFVAAVMAKPEEETNTSTGNLILARQPTAHWTGTAGHCKHGFSLVSSARNFMQKL